MKRTHLYWLISAILLICLTFLFTRLGIDWSKVAASFRRFPPHVVFLALVFLMAQIGCQILRLWFLLPGERLGLIPTARAFVYGQVVNAFAPARAGDALKVVLLRKYGATRDVTVAAAVGALLADKVVDVAAIVGLCLIFVSRWWKTHLQAIPLSSLAIAGEIFLGIVALLLFAERLFPKFKAWVLGHWRSFKSGLLVLGRPKAWFPAYIAGLSCWICEILALQLLASGQGMSLSFYDVLWVLVVLNLGIAIPVSVANVGAFEAAMVLGFSQVGVPLDQGLAIATMHHILQIVAVFGWGSGLASLRVFEQVASRKKASNPT